MNETLLVATVLALIGANGVFVAAEFALVTVRRPVVDERAAAGDRRARAVRRELSDVSFALSVAQFGITLTSLLVGFLAERAVGDVFLRPLLAFAGVPEAWSLPIALGGALLLSTAVQVVMGELVPKQLALARPLGVALALTPATRAFGQVLRPVIRLFDEAAAALARRLFSIEISDQLEGGRSLDELARIIDESGAQGSLTDAQTNLLRRAVILGDMTVESVMVPRPDIVWIEWDATVADLRELARATGHSRFPVRGEHEDEAVGSIHVKDALAVPFDEYKRTAIAPLVAPVLIVPESASGRALLSGFKRDGRTFALVIDEHGGTAGIVTVEDLLEALVGDITDEFDVEVAPVRRAGHGRFIVDGAMNAQRLDELCGFALPAGDYATVAGFFLDLWGQIPEPGNQIVFDGWVLTVLTMDELRITRLSLENPEAVS
ncbi:MAG: hemolysin family protein [Nitriliruptoraceae bacterium]